jgi:hypothetical protein
MALDSSGNVIVTGYVNAVDGQHYCTVKYNSAGIQQWVAIYKGPLSFSIDLAHAIGVDQSGNIYVTGKSGAGISGDNDYCTVKYNPIGVQQWERRYKLPGVDNGANSLAIDNSGFVYVTGSSGSYSATIKYTPQGDSVWVARYYSLNALSIAVDNQGNSYITGASSTQGMVTIKYNTSGVQQWVATYLNGSSYKVKIDLQNNVYIIGYGDGGKYITIKYDTSGVQQWKQNYTPSNGFVKDIAVDKNQNVYITGSIGSQGDYCTIKYNISGTQQWVNIYNGSANNNDEARSIILDDSSNVYVTGTVIEDSSRFGTIKYNTAGVQQWIKTYVGGGTVVLVDKYRNVYAAGGNSTNGNLDYFTIKYTQFVGVEPVSNNIPTGYELNQNYPNPFNPITNIEFSIPNQKGKGESLVTLIIYDALGRNIQKIIDDKLNPGDYKIQFDGSNFSSGIYFYQLIINEFQQTKTMVLIK